LINKNMKFVIYPQQNNEIAVISPSGVLPIEEVAKINVPANTPYKIVEALDIDSIFFDAYDFDQELGAVININRAKEIWKDKFRQARKPILEKLDIEFMRALESGDTQKQQEIAVQKQALRDVTKTPLPDDLEGIKNTWPNVLNS